MSSGTIKTLVAIFGTLIGVIGIYVNFIDRGDEQPNLVLEIQRLELIPTTLQGNYLDDLTRIEELYGAVTADKIHDLVNQVRQIDFTDINNTKQLISFNTQLQGTIKFFLKESKPRKINDIQYRNGVIIWPDGIDYDLLKDERVEMNFPNHIKKVRKSPNKLSAATIQELKQEAFNLYKPPGKETYEDRKNVATHLRAIRESIQNLINKNNLEISVKINVMNKSRLPNFIKSSAILRVHHKDSLIKDIPLSIDSNTLIPGFGFSSLMFKSERMEALDEKTREILMDNFGPTYNYSLFIHDSHNRIWYSTQGFLPSQPLSEQNHFTERIDELFKGFFD